MASFKIEFHSENGSSPWVVRIRGMLGERAVALWFACRTRAVARRKLPWLRDGWLKAGLV